MISPRILQIFVSCEALAEGLKHNSALANLILYNNNIGATGAQAWCLVRMLRNRSRGGGKSIWIQTELVEGEMVKQMCHHADLSEFELVLFISLETTYVIIRASMRRMQ